MGHGRFLQSYVLFAAQDRHCREYREAKKNRRIQHPHLSACGNLILQGREPRDSWSERV
jgi:hypothetical protein